MNSTERSEEGRYRRPQNPPPTHAYEAASPERMLDRYGISYICQHPEILFAGSYVPTIHLHHREHTSRDPAVYTLDDSLAPVALGASDEIAMRLGRMVEAYAILNEIYAPLKAGDDRGPAASGHVQPRQQRDRA